MLRHTEHDLYADTVKSVKQSAEKEFANHVITKRDSFQEWTCANPGTSIMQFHVICRPYYILIWGDIGDWILMVSDKDSFFWLTGYALQADYICSKIQAGENDAFYKENALKYLKDDANEAYSVDTVNKVRDHLKFKDDINEYTWREAWYEVGESEPFDALYPSVRALWLVEMIHWFAKNVHKENKTIPKIMLTGVENDG